MAVELRNALQQMAETNLAATLLFDYPTVEDLARHIGELLAPAEGRADAVPGRHAPPAAAQLPTWKKRCAPSCRRCALRGRWGDEATTASS